MDPRGFPTSLPEFQKVFPDDDACAKYLEAVRWPKGFACPTCGAVGGGRSRGTCSGVHDMATVIGAVEVRPRKDAEDRAAKYKESHNGGVPVKKLVYAGRLRLRVIPSREAKDLLLFTYENVTKGSHIKTDAWHGYAELFRFAPKAQSFLEERAAIKMLFLAGLSRPMAGRVLGDRMRKAKQDCISIERVKGIEASSQLGKAPICPRASVVIPPQKSRRLSNVAR